MISPPRDIDGATVLRFTDLSSAVATGKTRHVIKDEEAEPFAALAVAKYDSGPGFYLFYCDDEWRVVTDTYHETLEGAVAQAEFEFGTLNFIEPSG